MKEPELQFPMFFCIKAAEPKPHELDDGSNGQGIQACFPQPNLFPAIRHQDLNVYELFFCWQPVDNPFPFALKIGIWLRMENKGRSFFHEVQAIHEAVDLVLF